MNSHYDIAIVGGGPIGASLACCLANSGYRVIVLEKTSENSGHQSSYDDRGLALSLSSYRILNAVNIWPHVQDDCIPIRKIHISDRGNFGLVRLDASDLGLHAMGYVVVARSLGAALINQLRSVANIEYSVPAELVNISQEKDKVILQVVNNGVASAISSRLLVGADGASSRVRNLAGLPAKIKDYNQTAIVANITIQANSEFTAYERFTPDGPLALLPLGNSRLVSIFCVSAASACKYMEMNDEVYISNLQEVAGSRIGKIIMPGSRHTYPLKLVQTEPQYLNRVVMLGNSAHSIHPNGAQGFNLGLRDAAYLAELLVKNRKDPGFDPGSSMMLEDYTQFRKQDQERVINFSDGLTELFYTNSLGKKIIRNTAMSLFNLSPLIKNKFAKMAMGVDGRQPSLARGLQLDQL